MAFSINLHTMKSGWPIVYVEGHRLKFTKVILFLSLKIDFVWAYSEGTDQMPYIIWVFTVFQVTVKGFPGYKVLMGCLHVYIF